MKCQSLPLRSRSLNEEVTLKYIGVYEIFEQVVDVDVAVMPLAFRGRN